MAPLFQLQYGEDGYSIGRLIFDRSRYLNLGRTEIVHRLGYQNTGKGHQALSRLLRTGIVTPFVVPHLAAALEAEQDLIDQALTATEIQREDEAAVERLARERAHRAAFRPHLRVETERRRPDPIFVAAMIGTKKLLTIELPDGACSGDEDFRDRLVKRSIIDHFGRRRGFVPAFGKITGYSLLLVPGYFDIDFGWPFHVDGNRAGPMRAVERIGEAMLRVGNRAVLVPPGFFRDVIYGEPSVPRRP